MSLLALGAMLEGRHEYEIVDGNLDPDPAATIAALQPDVVGVSVMPGPQLRTAIPVTKRLKAERPDLTVVWGGYFPSLHTDTVLRSGYVDVVVRGQGETTFAELVDALADARAFDRIPGIAFV